MQHSYGLSSTVNSCIRARAIQCLDLIAAFHPQFRASISWLYICYTESSLAVRISRTKSCVTNWATPAQIMEVLFDERDNSFIFFFQQSTRWTVASRAPGERILSRIKRDYAHSFHLIVNSYVLTTRVRLCTPTHTFTETYIAVPVWLYNRWRQFAIARQDSIAMSSVNIRFLTSIIAVHRYNHLYFLFIA